MSLASNDPLDPTIADDDPTTWAANGDLVSPWTHVFGASGEQTLRVDVRVLPIAALASVDTWCLPYTLVVEAVPTDGAFFSVTASATSLTADQPLTLSLQFSMQPYDGTTHAALSESNKQLILPALPLRPVSAADSQHRRAAGDVLASSVTVSADSLLWNLQWSAGSIPPGEYALVLVSGALVSLESDGTYLPFSAPAAGAFSILTPSISLSKTPSASRSPSTTPSPSMPPSGTLVPVR